MLFSEVAGTRTGTGPAPALGSPGMGPGRAPFRLRVTPLPPGGPFAEIGLPTTGVWAPPPSGPERDLTGREKRLGSSPAP